MKIQIAGLFVVTSLFLMSACGQKGPLYLKKEPVPVAAAADVEKATEKSETESKMPAPAEKQD
ncbi:MAG: lipoprotein [Gammaproteobacteria bacterium]|nr:lipoprotein [Gammaproteobacteria bacterium]